MSEKSGDITSYDRLSDVPRDVLQEEIGRSIATSTSRRTNFDFWLDRKYFKEYGTLFADRGRRLNREDVNLVPRDGEAFERFVRQYGDFDDYWRVALYRLADGSLYLRPRDYSSVRLDDIVVPYFYHGIDSLLESLGEQSFGQRELLEDRAKRYRTLVQMLKDVFYNLHSVISAMNKYILLTGELDKIVFVDVSEYRRRNQMIEAETKKLQEQIDLLNQQYDAYNKLYSQRFQREIIARRQVVRSLTSLLSGAIFKTGTSPYEILPRIPLDETVESRLGDLMRLYRKFRDLLDRKRIRAQMMKKITDHRQQYQKDMNGSTLLFPFF